MANAIYTVVLDVTDNGCIDTGWRLHQGDYGESQVVVKIVNNGVNLFDASLLPQITFKRSDGISIVGEMFVEDSTYKYNFLGNELEIPGIVVMDVKLIDSQGRTSTAAARFLVLPNVEGDTQEGSHTYINSGLVSELRENVQTAVESAATSVEKALVSEGWANGEQNGEPVEQGSPYYHNNAKYWSQQSNPTRFGSLSDVDFGILRDDDIPVYDATSEKWVNEVGVSTEIKNASVVSGETKIRTRTGGILQSCGVKLDPVQDLHGYSKPWVGGSGKNKLNPTGESGTSQGIIVVKSDDGKFTASGTNGSGSACAILCGEFEVENGVSYTLTGCPSNGSSSSYRLDIRINGTSSLYKNLTDYGNGTTFTADFTGTLYICMRFVGSYAITGSLEFAPMVRLASETSATFEPYANICPISGHDEIVMNNDPKNWIPYIEDGGLNASTGAEEPTANRKRSGFIAIDRTKRYVISGFNVSMYGADIQFCYYNADKTFKGGEVINISQGQDIYFPSFSSGTAYIRFAASSSVITNKMQAEIGTVSTAYDPYREPEQTTIDIDSTVYGGELDVVSGSGPDEWANIASYNGETITEPWLSSMDEYVSGGTPTTGAQVVYKKATSTTASCTPTPVETLPNTNVMYDPSDGQTLMSAEYREAFAWSDVKSAIAYALAALT